MDRALRGNRLTKRPKTQQPSPGMGRAGPKASRKAPITSFGEEVDAGPTEMLGVHVSGGYQGKPHSTKEGRLMAGHRELDRFFYGRKKKKPKGTLV